MPLPDANNYSKRIYQLLEETDLQNLTYSQFQGVAEKLFIEPENEDEMRRLVLVQLARMAVRGDWDGFLTGGGGGGAPTDAEYVVMALDGTLTDERVLTAGTGLSLTDGGANGNATLANTGVTSNVAGTGISVSGATGAVTIANTGVTSNVAGDGIVLSGTTGAVTVSAPLIGDLVAAEYVTLATDTQLQNERVLTAGANITLTDAGAGSTLTIAATGGGSVTFPLEGDAGSVTAPTYSFSAATDVGMYLTGTTSVHLTAGSADLVSLQHDGTATDMRVGSGTGAAAVSSKSAQNLTLQTNDGTDSAVITINAGADNDVDIIPDGAGSLKVNGTGSFLSSKSIVVGDLNSTPMDVSTKTSILNSPQIALQVINATTSTAVAGSGAKIQFRNGDTNFAGYLAGSIASNQIDTGNHNLILEGAGSLGRVLFTNPGFKVSDPPASATATGTTGTVQYDASYIYVCTATDTWKRTAISTW